MVTSARSAPPRLAILVVEDDGELLASTREWVSLDFVTYSASTVQEALRVWDEHPELCVAVLDLKLPGEGKEAVENGLRLLSELARRPGAIVVVRSAFDEEERRALDLGARRFLPKGRRSESLLECLRELTEASADQAPSRSLPGTRMPMSDAMLRQHHDHDWALGEIDVLRRYAGQVVAVFAKAVWGHGPDIGVAIDSATEAINRKEGQPGTPSVDDLTFVVIPVRSQPEPPLPSY